MAFALLVAFGVSHARDEDDLSLVGGMSVAIGALFCGCLMGVLGATVAVPLGLAIDRWRGEPVPRRALDAWATLACIGAVAYGISSLFGVSAERWHDVPALELTRATANVVLPTLSLLLAVALLVVERVARRDLATLPATAPPGYRWVDAHHYEGAVAPSWALSEQPFSKALVRGTGEVSYREHSPTKLVAWWPADEPRSWREDALLIATVVSSVGLVIRLLR